MMLSEGLRRRCHVRQLIGLSGMGHAASRGYLVAGVLEALLQAGGLDIGAQRFEMFEQLSFVG